MRVTFRFSPRTWTIGFQTAHKPERLWLWLPMCEWSIRPGKECVNCIGQGGYQIEAGDGCWWDECEKCNGSGHV